MSDDKPTDPRTQVLLSLLPPGAVFRHCYSDDSLWRPDNRGYVNERDPLRAGLYQPDGHYAPWAPADKRPNTHSFTINAAEYLRKYTVQDGTTLALLIDEVLQLRARVKMHEEQRAVPSLRARSTAPQPCGAVGAEACVYADRWASECALCSAPRDVGRVVIVSTVIDDNDAVDDYLTQRLYNAGVWHITWISDAAKAAEHARELAALPTGGGVVVLTVTAEDVHGEFVTHVREDGRRVALADWCAAINPGRHVSDCENDDG